MKSMGKSAGRAARQVRTGMGMGRTANMTPTQAPVAQAPSQGLHPAAQASRDAQAEGETRMDRDRSRRWNAYRSVTS